MEFYRAVFDRGANDYRDLNAANHPFQVAGAAAGVKWKKLEGDFPDPIDDAKGEVSWGGLGRIKLALCERQPNNVYAIVCLKDREASKVFVSTNSGNSWDKTKSRSGDDGKQANYDLVLEVHPDRPEIFAVGIVDLFLTVNGGNDWTKIIDWLNYNAGDRAQHADQHGFLFDRADPRAIWATNDGGIAYSTNLGHTWRKRSHGILAVQFYDITNHPTYPHIYGGGYQDNGTWVSYGGPTWYYLSGGDGGAMAFQHGETQFFLTTWQGNKDTKRSLMRIAVTSRPEASNLPEIVSSLPDIPGTRADGGPPFLKYVAKDTDITDDFASKHFGIFGGKLQGHPSSPNHWIMARHGAAYVSKAGTTLESENGPEFEKLGLPDYFDNFPDDDFPVETSAIAYAPSDPANEWWIGTDHGELFHTANGGTQWRKIGIGVPGRLRGTLTNQSNNPAAGISAAGAIAVLPGDLVAVNYATRGTMAGLGFTDNLGNRYSALNAAGSGNGRVQPFFAVVNNPGNLTTVTAAHAVSSNDAALVVAVFEGPFQRGTDKNPACIADSNAPYVCPETDKLGQASELVVGFVAQGDGAAAYNAMLPFALADFATSGAGADTVSGAINYRLVTETNSQTPRFTTATETSGSTGTATFLLVNRSISEISVHPQNSSIVAVAVANSSHQVYISGDKGATWRDVTGPDPATGGTGMFRVAASSVVIDPRGPATTGAADLQTLYLGSLAGIFVSRNITPDPTGPTPVWRTLSNNLPLTLVRDIEYGRYENPPGTLVRHYLRAASYGRGAFHLELDTGALGAALAGPTTPNVRLLIRSTPIDDGQIYAGAARLANDPRLRDPDNGAQTALTPHIACDIRIDAPPFTFFDRVLDGAEFDEEVRSDKLVIGETNLINVQVHNTGFETTPAPGVGPPASDVIVRLYFADAAAGTAPDLDANFWTTFPASARGRRDLAAGRRGPGALRRAGPAARRALRVAAADHARQSRCAAGARLAKPPRRPLDHEQWQPAGGSAVPRRCRPRHPGAARGASHRRCGGVRPRPLRARLGRRFRRPRRGGLGCAGKRHHRGRQLRSRPDSNLHEHFGPARSRHHSRPGRWGGSGCREFHLHPSVEQQERAAVGDGQALLCACREAVVSGRLDRGPRRHRERRSPCERHSAARPQILGRVPAHQSARSRPRTRVQGGGLDRRGEFGRRRHTQRQHDHRSEEILGVLPRHRKRQQCVAPRLTLCRTALSSLQSWRSVSNSWNSLFFSLLPGN